MLFYCSGACWIPSSSQNGSVKQDFFVLLSSDMSGCFSEFCHGARDPIKLCVTELGLFGKTFFAPKIAETVQTRFLNLKKNLVDNFH